MPAHGSSKRTPLLFRHMEIGVVMDDFRIRGVGVRSDTQKCPDQADIPTMVFIQYLPD